MILLRLLGVWSPSLLWVVKNSTGESDILVYSILKELNRAELNLVTRTY
jgi:hypothetical protein